MMVGLVMITYLSTYMHESAHQTIAGYYGCVDSSIEISILGPSYHVCHRYSNTTTQAEAEQERVLDSYNEIVSYNMQTISVAIIFASFIFCITILLLG